MQRQKSPVENKQNAYVALQNWKIFIFVFLMHLLKSLVQVISYFD